MANPYGITLDEASLRWAAAEGVPESVIAAICLLAERSVDEIVAKLSPVELEQIIKIVGRSPRAYPPGALEALKGKRNLAQPQPLTERLSRNVALKSGQPAARTNPGTEHSRRIRARRFNAPHLEVPQTSAVSPTSDERSAATTVEKPGTRPGTRAETARRRLVVADLRRAGLIVRTIAAGTGIPVGSVHRAICAIARAQAKQEVAIIKITAKLLNKRLRG